MNTYNTHKSNSPKSPRVQSVNNIDINHLISVIERGIGIYDADTNQVEYFPKASSQLVPNPRISHLGGRKNHKTGKTHKTRKTKKSRK